MSSPSSQDQVSTAGTPSGGPGAGSGSPAPERVRSGRRLDRLITLALALITVAWLLGVEGRQGFGRDEGQYMRAGERYWGWFEQLWENARHGRLGDSFTRAGIDHYWSDNAPDHPVVMKTLFGLSWRAFHRCTCTGPARGLHPIPVRGRHLTIPLFERESTAFRFPAILMAALLVAAAFRFGRQFVPWPAAAAGAVLTLAQPHYFFHAPIACFDAPITTMAFVVGFAYWKSLRSPRWGIACGVLYGIALGTKHNAWLIPFFLVAHYAWMRRGDLAGLVGALRRRPRAPAGSADAMRDGPGPRRTWRLPRIPLAFVSMATLGPIIFLLHWPWLWHRPTDRVELYFRRHLQHEHYNFEYLGLNWNLPPTDAKLKLVRTTFPFVSTLFTVPVTTLALAAWGATALARRRRGQPVAEETDAQPREGAPTWLRPGADVDRAPGVFFAVQILGPIAVVALPGTPIFGGVKHFMPAMPFLAVLAAIGLHHLGRVVRGALADRRRLARGAPLALAGLVCLPAVLETRRSHPDGLSHYNLLAGGFAGGASLGMNRQFWAYCVLPVLDWVNAKAPQNRQMYWHDVLGDALNMYKRERRLDMSVGDTGFGEPGIQRSAMGLMVIEKHWAIYESWFWRHYGTLRPVLIREREGVPLVIGYERGSPR